MIDSFGFGVSGLGFIVQGLGVTRCWRDRSGAERGPARDQQLVVAGRKAQLPRRSSVGFAHPQCPTWDDCVCGLKMALGMSVYAG